MSRKLDARPGPRASLDSLTKDVVHHHFDVCVDAGVIMFDRDFVTETRTVDNMEARTMLDLSITS